MPVTAPAGRLTAHGDAARFAELPVLRLHAGRDPCHIGDDIGTKPHRIGRARLAGGIAALGGRALGTTKQQGEQHNAAGEVNDPHGYPLGLATFCAGEFADEIGRHLAQSKSRLRRHLLVQRWRKYDLAGYAEACDILPAPVSPALEPARFQR